MSPTNCANCGRPLRRTKNWYCGETCEAEAEGAAARQSMPLASFLADLEEKSVELGRYFFLRVWQNVGVGVERYHH